MTRASVVGSAADRNLLFGILALQMDFISRDALIGAMNAWVLDKSKPLGQILQEQLALAADARELLEALVQKHLGLHGNDAEKSLAAVSSVSSVREQLQQIADPELHATLTHVAAAPPPLDDPHATVTWVVGAAAGQRYRILRPHARGGLGEVFVAMDEEVHREVALKEMQECFAHQVESRNRFVREAEITGGLEHPGIVPVYGLGQYADGRPFYAMRLIKGASLNEAIADYHKADVPGRDPGERTLAMRKLLGRFLDVCNAMAYAHSRRVLHRDLKPGNIMLGQYGETLVVDWGLAKPLGQPEAPLPSGERPLQPTLGSDSAPTEMGRALGTPAYMSPEQAAGQHDRLGPASDVYSLGATLYCLLTGQAPVEISDAGLMLQRVQKGDFPPPRQVKPQVPAALEAICLRAMALHPAQRYASVGALAEDVEHWLADEPVSAWPEPWTVRAQRWLGRHRTLVTATAAAILVAIFSLAGATVLLTAANEELAAADAGERQAKEYAQGKELEAIEKRDEARKEKKKADDELLRAEWLVYAGKISRAQREWETNNANVTNELLGTCRWDFRGWEHDYLHTLLKSNQVTFRGHTQPVSSVAVSPDGKRLASGSFDKTVKVWDAQTGQCTFTLGGHTDQVNSVAFSPDGKRLVSGSKDMSAKIWDTQTGQNTLTFKRHAGAVSSVAFSPDGKRVVSGGFDRKAKVWDSQTGQEIFTLVGHFNAVMSVAFSPDGKRLASGGGDRMVKIWDAETGQHIMTRLGPGARVSVAFSPDSKRLVSAGSNDKTLIVWDAATGQQILILKAYSGSVQSVAFSPDGKHLAGCSEDGTVKVWDAQTGQDTRTLWGHTGTVNSVAFSPDGRRLVSGGEDRTVKVWDALSGQDTFTLKAHTGEVWSVAFSPDGKRLVSRGHDFKLLNDRWNVKLWDAQTGRKILTLNDEGGLWVSSVMFSPDGKYLVSGGADGTIKVWDARTGQNTSSFSGHAFSVSSLAFSPDGKRLVSGSLDKTLKVWNGTTGKEIITFKGQPGPVSSVAFSPDGKRLLSGSWDETVKVWDVQTGQQLLTLQTGQQLLALQGRVGVVNSVAFSPDGKHLVSGHGDGTLRVWDATTGQETLILRGHTGPVTSVAVTLDGKRLVSGSDDRTVKFWDAQTGQETLTLRGHAHRVFSLAFSRDGKRLASGSEDGTVKIWDAHKRASR